MSKKALFLILNLIFWLFSNSFGQIQNKDSLQVNAYLVYEDDRLSSFQIINNDTLGLWNTIIGEGDAEKPSKKFMIEITGVKQDLGIEVFKFDEDDEVEIIYFDYDLRLENKEIIYINSRNCDKVFIAVFNQNSLLFNGVINFMCGE